VIERFFKRLFCWHLAWSESGMDDPNPFGVQEFMSRDDFGRNLVCADCGKYIYKNWGWQPINFLR